MPNERLIQIAIVDDEALIRNEVHKIVVTAFKKANIAYLVREFESGEKFIKEEKPYHLVLLDIDMPGRSGIEIASEYRKISANGLIIFLTSMEEMSKKGYKVNAFRFIGKLDERSELEEAILDAIRCLEEKKVFRFQNKQRDWICVNQDEILYFESIGRMIQVVSKNGSYEMNDTMENLEKRLQAEHFFQIHRAFYVHLSNVAQLQKKDILLTNGVSLPISEKRRQAFKEAFVNYKFERGNA